MKVDKNNVIALVPSGSRLYGTFHEKSDYDFKAIVLPSMDDLLCNKKLQNVKEKPIGIKAQDKMIAGGVETEYLPLQVFLDDFYNGQTYALETAFAISQGFYEGDADFKAIIDELLSLFLNRNVKKMMGYAIGQARLYGVKTERYASIKRIIELIQKQIMIDGELVTSLIDHPLLITELFTIEHVKFIQISTHGNDTNKVDAIDVIGKTYLFTNKLTTIVNSLHIVFEQYGGRVKEFEGEGVDWKALSHAIRITEQVVELCSTCRIVFPRPNAKKLADIKNGKITVIEATTLLTELFTCAELATSKSHLREQTPELFKQFEEWKIVTLRSIYFLNRLSTIGVF